MESSQRGSPRSDGDLVQAYRNGDARAFEQLLRRYERPLFTFVARMVSDRDDAKDIFQETLSRVIEKIGSYDERGKFGAWLFGIAHHLCVDRSRRQVRWKFIPASPEKLHFGASRHDDDQPNKARSTMPFGQVVLAGESFLPEEIKDPTPLPDALVEQEELRGMLTEALQHLPPQQREVFLLRQHTDLSFREIAEMLDRPLNTVLGQMHVAILSMRTHLKERMK